MSRPAPIPARTLPASRDWALFLDVDGTLLPIAGTPDDVTRSDALCHTLSRLAPALEGALALISGRTIADLDRLFAPLALSAAGLHGLERRDADGRLHLLGEAAALDHLRAPLAALAAENPGLILEDKGRALALHYRQAPELEAEVRERSAALTGPSGDELRLIHGKMVVEIKPRHTDKGSAIRAFMAEPPFAGRTAVFLGDDVTDEDGFRAVNAMGGLSIHVGSGHVGAGHAGSGRAETGDVGLAARTAARYQLSEVDQVWRWLEATADALTALNEGPAP